MERKIQEKFFEENKILYYYYKARHFSLSMYVIAGKDAHILYFLQNGIIIENRMEKQRGEPHMKVLLVNGSPHKEGCTYTALAEVAGALQKNGVENEWYQLGTKPVQGCIACGKCRKELGGRCVFDDEANRLAERIRQADGVVIGSPVYYGSANGALCALLDRTFYSAGDSFSHTPAAAVVSCRRAGSVVALDRLNRYFTLNRMPLVPSQYWNMVHGARPEDVQKDEEGLQIMRTLGDEMAWLLKSIQAGGIEPPRPELPRKRTNFIPIEKNG